jgi:hypothetical protein
MDIMGALLQHMRDYRQDLEEVTREISLIREKATLERERVFSRLDRIDQTLDEIKEAMAKPVQFTFGHFWSALWVKAGFGIGMTLASMKLPDAAAARLFEFTKLLIGG